MFSVESLYVLAKILKATYPEVCETLRNIEKPISSVELYKILGLDECPKVVPYEEENLLIREMDFNTTEKCYGLFVKNERWMTFTPKNFEQLFEVYSHYNLAKGHCICTGLGFGLREKWLLSKKEVSKVTIIEKNIDVINYHKKINPDLIDQIEVINCDASEYKGQCDTLLLDHYESEPFLDLDGYFENVKKCSNNIIHDTMWFWPLETILSRESYDFIHQEYDLLKKQFPTLPDINEEQLNSYYDMFNFANRFSWIIS